MTQRLGLDAPNNIRPTLGGQTNEIHREIRKLWKALRGGGLGPPQDKTWTLAGALYLAHSCRWYPPNFGGRIIGASASLDTPGTTQTVCSVRVNGVQIGTVTIPASQNYSVSLGLDEFVSASDYVTIHVTTAGAGAGYLTVQLQIRLLT